MFVYHHPAVRSDPMDVDFGVEVLREFVSADDVAPRSEFEHDLPLGATGLAVLLRGRDFSERIHLRRSRA